MTALVLRLYQALGQVKHRVLYTVFGFTSYCKHTPTCSRYIEKQIRERGTIVGSLQGLVRIMTCW